MSNKINSLREGTDRQLAKSSFIYKIGCPHLPTEALGGEWPSPSPLLSITISWCWCFSLSIQTHCERLWWLDVTIPTNSLCRSDAKRWRGWRPVDHTIWWYVDWSWPVVGQRQIWTFLFVTGFENFHDLIMFWVWQERTKVRLKAVGFHYPLGIFIVVHRRYSHTL